MHNTYQHIGFVLLRAGTYYCIAGMFGVVNVWSIAKIKSGWQNKVW